MPVHTNDHIRRRRERVAALLCKGATPRDVSEGLEITMRIVNSDIKWMNKENEHKMFEMARIAIPTLYEHCLQGVNELIKQAWQIYVRPNENIEVDDEGNRRRVPVDPRDWITPTLRARAIEIAGNLQNLKFNMIQNGPAIFELKKLERQVNDLRRGIEIPI